MTLRSAIGHAMSHWSACVAATLVAALGRLKSPRVVRLYGGRRRFFAAFDAVRTETLVFDNGALTGADLAQLCSRPPRRTGVGVAAFPAAAVRTAGTRRRISRRRRARPGRPADAMDRRRCDFRLHAADTGRGGSRRHHDCRDDARHGGAIHCRGDAVSPGRGRDLCGCRQRRGHGAGAAGARSARRQKARPHIADRAGAGGGDGRDVGRRIRVFDRPAGDPSGRDRPADRGAARRLARRANRRRPQRRRGARTAQVRADRRVLAIEELSKILPDHTYVTELHLADAKLQMVGLTRDAPSLIPLIEQTGHFTRATFFAPTTRAPSDPGERFHIETRVEADPRGRAMNTAAIDREVARHPVAASAAYAVILGLFVATSWFAVTDISGRQAALGTATGVLDQLQSRNPAAGGAIGAAMAGSPFLEGPTVTVAGAALLQRVAGAIAKVGGSVQSSQVDVQGARSQNGFVGLLVSCEIDQPSLQTLLYDIEAGMPFLFVDQLDVQAPQGAGAPDGAGRLRVMLGVSGQWQGHP